MNNPGQASKATSSPTAAGAAPVPEKAPVPGAPAPAAEDDQQEEGTSIDTFCDYQPTALCAEVVAAYNKNFNGNNNSSSSSNNTNNDDEKENQAVPKLLVPSHTSSAVESNLLASVAAPRIHPDTAACLWPLLESGALSPLQAEGVLLGIQRHQRIFASPNGGFRAGFFLGDGAGIGKGRQISAMIRDSLCRKDVSKKSCWLSVSRELIQDAKRDLKDCGVHVDVHDGIALLDNKKAGLGQATKGVLFLTYPLLVSSNRLEQLVEWCAGTAPYKKSKNNIAKVQELEHSFDGCIIFDESHKAKNLVATDTKTGKLVLALQRRLPRARIVYCSATGVSDVAHLAYCAERLALCGRTTMNGDDSVNADGPHFGAFPTFSLFRSSLESKGLAALELLSLEFKQQGTFLARTLSWDGAEFETRQVTINKAQQAVYDQAVEWWLRCKSDIEHATKILDFQPKMLWRAFWSAHQRFFKELAICGKVANVSADALKQHEKGMCVVIGLQSTGEAAISSLLEKFKGSQLENQEFQTLPSTLKAVSSNFVSTHFPTKPNPPEPPKLPSKQPSTPEELQQYSKIQREIERIAALPEPDPDFQLVEMQAKLVEAIHEIDLPPNPLDDLVDRLGGIGQVAEMTGRSGRMVRKKNLFVYSKRFTESNQMAAAAQDASDRINLVERRQFMDGKKPFAIISDAASTGISLHAAEGSGGSHKRRVHYTIELPWSADKAVQQLGRSHRSGQESAPIYKLVVTNLGGERRFAAAVSKRMAQLGALTKGDRRAATGSDMLQDFDLDSRYGKRALKRFYSSLADNEMVQSRLDEVTVLPSSCLPSRNATEILDQFVEQMIQDQDPMLSSLPTKNVAMKHSAVLAMATQSLVQVGLDQENRSKADVRVFLNRLAGLPVARQTLVFMLFMATFDDVIKEAKLTGEFEGTAEDISATHMSVDSEDEIAVDPFSSQPTKLTTLALDRGISFESVCNMAMEEAQKVMAAVDNVVEDTETEEKDDDDDSDVWMSSGIDSIATPGCYVSRNLIVGRHLVLFAKQKFDRSAFKSQEQAANLDPMGWMVITRPNTGTSVSMSSADLETKYRLVNSCEKLKELIKSYTNTSEDDAKKKSLAELVEQVSPQISNLWNIAFHDSNRDSFHLGLAPRLVKVALVTGPVLFLMPALEKAVALCPPKDRALKVMRAQVEGGRGPLVGVRFPHDEEVIMRLKLELEKLKNARVSAGDCFVDEPLPPVCEKRIEWATTEQKTMKSFFQVAPKSTPAIAKIKTAQPAVVSNNGGKNGKSMSGKRGPTSSMSNGQAGKKVKPSTSITSFFGNRKK